MSLTGSLLAQLQLILSTTDDAGITTSQRVGGEAALSSWTLDDTADEADDLVVIQSTLAASASETWDLADASNTLTNAFGESINWSELQAVLFLPDSANGGTMTIGGAANECFDATEPVPAGGVLLWSAQGDAGKSITDGSADEIKVTNDDAGDTADYVLVLLGVAA